jgi:hypothetical protein
MNPGKRFFREKQVAFDSIRRLYETKEQEQGGFLSS